MIREATFVYLFRTTAVLSLTEGRTSQTFEARGFWLGPQLYWRSRRTTLVYLAAEPERAADSPAVLGGPAALINSCTGDPTFFGKLHSCQKLRDLESQFSFSNRWRLKIPLRLFESTSFLTFVLNLVIF